MYSTEKTIEIERKASGSNTLTRKASKAKDSEYVKDQEDAADSNVKNISESEITLLRKESEVSAMEESSEIVKEESFKALDDEISSERDESVLDQSLEKEDIGEKKLSSLEIEATERKVSIAPENLVENERKTSVESQNPEENVAENVLDPVEPECDDRKVSEVCDIIRKISELNENIDKDDTDACTKQVDSDNNDNTHNISVSKVSIENNESIINTDDDDDDNEDDNDYDSVEDDIQNIPTVFNKSRKNSEVPSVTDFTSKDEITNSSSKKFSQKFLNPFEPPCPELVNKTALIQEFEMVQVEFDTGFLGILFNLRINYRMEI